MYTDAEKVAIEYTERFAVDHRDIDDSLFDRLRLYFDEGEIVELTMTIARHLAFGRLTKVLELDQVCAIPGAAGPDQANPINYH